MYKDDKKWVESQLMLLPTPQMRQHALNKYKQVFASTHNSEKLQHRKDGKARAEANSRLRVYVKKVISLCDNHHRNAAK